MSLAFPVKKVDALLATVRGISVGVMYPGKDTPDGVPLIRAGDIKLGVIDPTVNFRISKEVHYEYRRTALEGGELLITLVGNPGVVASVPPHMVGWNAARAVAVVRLNEPNDAAYFKAAFGAPYVQHMIRNVCNTTVQATLNLKEIRALEIPWPAKPVRDGIAKVLGGLDDKIEVNRKMVATLEAMARTLYRSWFVDFDPVHARSQGLKPSHMDDATAALFPDRFGDDGLPEGWGMQRLGELLKLNYGKALTKNLREPGNFPVYGSGGTSSTHVKALVAHPTVVVGRKGTVGTVFWAPHGCWPIDTTYYVTTEWPMVYAFRALQHLPLSDMNTDAAVPGLNRENAYRLEVPFPGEKIIGAFEEIAGAIQNKIDSNEAENKTLATLRDALLPRLMSGELRVGEDREMAEGVV